MLTHCAVPCLLAFAFPLPASDFIASAPQAVYIFSHSRATGYGGLRRTEKLNVVTVPEFENPMVV